ncbi:MAG TPA: bifunctional 4-hydroxy-2-oxoglutarate aldolase/2-dehydro-3-deoxy-phosphogluconate aldolase [Burkholderiaceae bacterium]|nr:bifunctional 4-hydroxy-2-oxoglutarate aldolase/2-dehydro-3-deoxy-phosphogluconate aldolase [Burkholderiaceae bacterium]
MKLDEILSLAPVIPVIVLDDAAQAKPLAAALAAGGLRVLEVTLRTNAALESISRMREVDGVIVGAGTVLDAEQLRAAIDAGAQFAVSPGLTPPLARAAQAASIELLPGVVTASEVMVARESGFRQLKFFPAESSGGVAQLKSFASVFRDVVFCPTGGITPLNAKNYLALPNVACVGGSWLTPPELLRAGNRPAMTELARAAATLRN